MDLIARILGRFKVANQLVERIEKIPGFDRSNFLRSLRDQALRGRALSDKQLAVLDKIEREAKPGRAETPKVPSNAIDWAPKGYYDSNAYHKLVDTLRKNDVAYVIDRRGHFMQKVGDLTQAMTRMLETDFYGGAEMYAERNADEDHPDARKHNYEMVRRFEDAADAVGRSSWKVENKGGVLEVSLRPSIPDIMRRYRLDR